MHKIQKMSIILLFFYCFSFCVLEKSLIQDNISSYQVVSSQSVFYISNQVGYYYDLSSTKSQTITLNGGNGSHYLFQGKDNHLLYIYMKTKSFTYTLIDSQKSDTVSFPLSYTIKSIYFCEILRADFFISSISPVINRLTRYS